MKNRFGLLGLSMLAVIFVKLFPFAQPQLRVRRQAESD